MRAPFGGGRSDLIVMSVSLICLLIVSGNAREALFCSVR